MKTAIILPVWKRPEITELCFDVLEQTGCDIFVGVSEPWAVEMCMLYGFDYAYIENKPLGKKKNKLLGYALKHEWDQVLEIGSDNLLDLEKLDDYLSIPNPHYSVNCSYMIDLKTRRAKYVRFGGKRKIWGAGRVVSRGAVERALPLWDDRSNQYLDAQANEALERAGYQHSVVGEPLFCGIKTETNIHSYDRFSGEPVSIEFMGQKFPALNELLATKRKATS